MKKNIINIWREIAARPCFEKVNKLMFDCSLRGLGILNYENDRVSGERYFVEKLLPMYMVGDDDIVMLDVGANVGSYSRLLREHNKSASLLAFEPNPLTYSVLEKEVEGLNVKTVPKGVGAEESKLKFYDRMDSGGSSPHGSLYREVIEGLHDAEVVEMTVEVVSLDEYSRDNGINKVKLLKIDTEGHELEVLRGCKDLLEEGNIDLIHLEFNEMNIISRVFFRDIMKFLPDYAVYRLLPTGVIQLGESPLRTELFAFQNVVFVHERFKPNKAMEPTL